MSVKVFIILVTVAAGAILLAATVIACKVLSLVLKGVKKGRERRGLATCVCTAALAYTTTA